MNRFDWINFWAEISPDKTAVIQESTGESLSYSVLNEMGAKLSNYLQRQWDFKKNDRIIVIAPNCFEYLYLFAAALKIGICIVPLNYRLNRNELSKLIYESDARLVLYHSDHSHLIEDLNNAFELNTFFKKIKETKFLERFEQVALCENDSVFILFTSGSSGFPKGVRYTHKMMFWNSINTQISLVINNETKTIICLPPFHTGAWNVLMTPLLHVGGTVILMKKFDAPKVLKAIERHECQIFMGVPTMLRMMRDEESFDETNLSSLRYIIVGGEAMDLKLIEDYYDKGVPIRQGYGMTEVGPNLTSLHENYAIEKIGSIGKPNMYVNTKIIREDGQEAGVNESGELWLEGPVVTPGYFNLSDMSTEVFEEGGWFKTGDIVKQDEDGFLYIVDRKKNMYISGAENVYPAEVERFLINHQAILEVVIIGVPDKQWGEVGYAFIHSNDYDADEIRKFCKENISKYKIPKYIKMIDSFPKTESGKMDRKLLKELALSEVSV